MLHKAESREAHMWILERHRKMWIQRALHSQCHHLSATICARPIAFCVGALHVYFVCTKYSFTCVYRYNTKHFCTLYPPRGKKKRVATCERASKISQYDRYTQQLNNQTHKTALEFLQYILFKINRFFSSYFIITNLHKFK